MKWRWIAAVICMLYTSVGFVASAHDHSGHDLAGHQQCDACAWHHNNHVDVPVTTERVPVPQRILIGHEAPTIIVFQSAISIHECRGPPAIPQL